MAAFADAATFVVTKTADTNDGVCDVDCSLREAAAKANASLAPDVITFDPVVFAGPQTIVLTGGPVYLTSKGNLHIKGPGAARLTISSNLQSRIFDIYFDNYPPYEIILSDLTIASGRTTSGGGCIHQDDGILKIERAVVRNCDGNGAIYTSLGDLIIRDSLLSSNTGGAIFFGGSGSETNPTLLTIENSTISGNSTGGQGGGIRNLFGIATLTNVTVAHNSAVEEGGGIYNAFNGTTTKLKNTIIANNTSSSSGPDFSGNLTSLGYNLIRNSSGATITGNATGNVLGQDPRLGGLGYNGGSTQSYALLAGSPAIDAGDPASHPGFDQLGAVRPLDGDGNGTLVPDIGAIESGARIVSKTADTSDGTCDADCSLREAIAAANSAPGNQAILFSELFHEPQTITLTDSFLNIFRNGKLSVTGPGSSALSLAGSGVSGIFVNGDNNSTLTLSGMRLTGSTLSAIVNFDTMTLNDMTISGISGNSSGPAVNNQDGATLTVNDSSIIGNTATDSKGAIYNQNASLTINRSVISGNSTSGFASDGGGLYNFFGSVTIESSIISGNSATGEGGGLKNAGGTLNINRSTVAGNTAGGDGGGIYNSANGGVMAVVESTVSGNQSLDQGGGLYNYGQLSLTNSTVSGNSAIYGGGLYINSGEGVLTATNSTIVRNIAANGGGLQNQGTVNTRNTIAADNTATASGSDILGVINSQGYNLFENTSGLVINGTITGNILGQDPRLDPTLRESMGPTWTHAPRVDSPVIDRGDNCVVLAPANGGCLSQNLVTDQRGLQRSSDGIRDNNPIVDIGAFEATVEEVSGTPRLPDLQAAADTGIGNSDNLTRSRSLPISVGVSVQRVECFRDGVLVASSNSSGSTFTFTDSGLPADGIFSYSCRSIPGAGATLLGPALTVVVDNTSPNITVNQAPGQGDPTGVLPLKFSVQSSEPIYGLALTDFVLSGTVNATAAALSFQGIDTQFELRVSNISSNGGVLRASVGEGSVFDAAGNLSPNSTSSDNEITLDNIGPSVTVEQAATQSDPALSQPINFTVVFNEQVSGFTAADVSLSGSTADVASAQLMVSGSGNVYNVGVTNIRSSGQVKVSVIPGAAADAIGNPSTQSSSSDNIVTLIGNARLYDYDGDGRADLSVRRPSDNIWYILRGTAGYFNIEFGVAGDMIAPADYDGDGKTDVAVFRPSNGTWYIFNSQSQSFTTTGWGANGDLPVPADHDGDGKADLVVFRPSTNSWYTRFANGTFSTTAFGVAGDKPVVGDFDGDGRYDIALFRPSDSNWYILKTGFGFFVQTWGQAGDIPVPADYDGDGATDVAVFRPSTGQWFRIESTAGFDTVNWGANGDQPIPADYDGDGKSDVAVFRPSNSTWYIVGSTSGQLIQNYGVTGDLPTQGAFIY